MTAQTGSQQAIITVTSKNEPWGRSCCAFSRRSAESCEELYGPGEERVLQRHHLSSGHSRLHDSGGDPNSKNPDRASHGMGGPGHNVKAEFNSKPHKRGTLSMARANDPDSAGSQFFICVNDANFWIGNIRCSGKCRAGSTSSTKWSEPSVTDGTTRWSAWK